MKSTSREIIGITALLMIVISGAARPAPAAIDPAEHVGIQSPNRALVPTNQILTPAGTTIELPGFRPQVLALSPDGKLLVSSGLKPELVVMDPEKASVLQHVILPTHFLAAPGHAAPKPEDKGEGSYTGLVFSPDGRRLYLSSATGSIKVFSVSPDDKVSALYCFSLPKAGAPDRSEAIPAGLALSPDGSRLYVAMNLSNRLAEIDTTTGQTLRMFNVGVAPYDVVLLGQKAYVSNWGGRRPDADSVTGPAGKGTRVRVDPVRFIASEGSVSVVDLTTGKVTETPVGLHSCGMALGAGGKRLYVTNAASDSLSVIDTATDSVVETIPARQRMQDPFGASPNALAVQSDANGNDTTLYVCNGTQNALAVISLGASGQPGVRGLIPTGWYPGAVILDSARNRVYAASIKGLGAWNPSGLTGKPKYNSHDAFGAISIIPLPDGPQLNRYTAQVMDNNHTAMMAAGLLPPRPGVPPRPIPERAGEPSVFKHVIYIIKENRTYDQVLGDIKEGNGDPDLCIFGEKVTPNLHKLAQQFTLLDNLHCCSVLSADGHEWADSAMATDYMERSFCGWPRSYPDLLTAGDVDALAYSPAGFIWDDALAHGKTLRIYGEATIGSAGWKDPGHKGRPHFLDFYRDFINKTGLTTVSCRPSLASLSAYIKTDTIGWDLAVPDQLRATKFIEELTAFDRAGKMPDLCMMSLPDDHTSGTRADAPTPAAQEADNDLALGRIVEAVSHSQFWKDTCIFVCEDDPQNGFDHVDSYRTEAFAISAYTRRHAVVSVLYNQPGILHTIELILGLPPMNAMDATATPMSACFMPQPDMTPYDIVPNNIPLDQMNPAPTARMPRYQRQDALASARLPLELADQCPEDLFNRILWRSQKGIRTPYPNWAITATDDDDDDKPAVTKTAGSKKTTRSRKAGRKTG